MRANTREEAVQAARSFVESALQGSVIGGKWQVWPKHSPETGELQTLLRYGMCTYLRVEDGASSGLVKVLDRFDRECQRITWGPSGDELIDACCDGKNDATRTE